MPKLSKIESIEDRLRELEIIVCGRRRPPSRLANVFRYLVANIDVLEQVVERYKKEQTDGIIRHT
jgi:hypothetical protein